MKIDRIGFDQRAVIVLGAGATRGASFVNDSTGALPPLDGDFFTQAQRLSTKKPRELLNRLIEDVVGAFGSNFALTMEGYLTRLEQLAHVLDDYRFRGRPAENQYLRMRGDFLQVLAALLDESIGRDPKCDYHASLVKALSTRDAILSLNYDWLIDRTLKTHGTGKWNPQKGYGVAAYTKGDRGTGTKYWACTGPDGNPKLTGDSVLLLKLHGSMNWFPTSHDRESPRLELRQRWWHQKGNLKFEIAPPEWNKPTRSGIYVPVWRRAREALRKARGLVFIGYSLPETDLPVQALLTVEKSPNALELLVTVNPERDARRRIRAVLQRRLDQQTRVLSFDRLEDFHGFLQ